MENYFDIATPEELEETYEDVDLTPEFIAERRLYYETHPDLNNQRLFLLFCERGNEDKANRYLEMIKDPMVKLDTTMLAYECIRSR